MPPSGVMPHAAFDDEEVTARYTLRPVSTTATVLSATAPTESQSDRLQVAVISDALPVSAKRVRRSLTRSKGEASQSPPRQAPVRVPMPPAPPIPTLHRGKASSSDSVSVSTQRGRRFLARPAVAAPQSPPVPTPVTVPMPPAEPPTPASSKASVELLPIEILRLLLDHFAEYAGPAARPILIATIEALGATPERFPRARRGELVERLAACLDDPGTRRVFVADALQTLEWS